MHIAVVLNTSAGSLLGRDAAEAEVAGHLAAAGLDATIIPDHPGGLLARLDAAIAQGADAIVVGGGDGTIAAAAGRLMGTGTALGILPLGTMNMLAKDLGIPLTMAAAADALARGDVRAIDVGEVNGHIFLCNSVIGSPSWLGRHRERQRGKASLRTRIAFALAALRAAWRHRPMRLRIQADGRRPIRLWTRALSVANNRYTEGFGQVMARSRLDGGHLMIYVARRYGIWWWVRLMAGMFLGTWRGSRLVHEQAARQVVIHSPRTALRVMSDGEAAVLATPLTYRIHPGALRVIVPEARGE